MRLTFSLKSKTCCKTQHSCPAKHLSKSTREIPLCFLQFMCVSHYWYGVCSLLSTGICFLIYLCCFHDWLSSYILKLQNIKDGLTTTKSNPHSLHGELGMTSIKTCRVPCDPGCQMCGKREGQPGKPMLSFVLPWIMVLQANDATFNETIKNIHIYIYI